MQMETQCLKNQTQNNICYPKRFLNVTYIFPLCEHTCYECIWWDSSVQSICRSRQSSNTSTASLKTMLSSPTACTFGTFPLSSNFFARRTSARIELCRRNFPRWILEFCSCFVTRQVQIRRQFVSKPVQ